MARLTTVRVMISSRSKQRFPYKGNVNAQLSDIRKDLAGFIEKEELFGQPLFEAWINELAPAAEGTEDIWDKCLDEVNRAELVISLYNGDAGWAKAGGEIGICHAELHEGYSKAQAKVRILQLTPLAPRRKGPDGKRDDLFRDYVEKLHRFTGDPCENGEQVIELCRRTLREAVGDMVKLGVREARRGKFYSGDALDWSHLDFRDRRRAMVQVLLRALERRGGSAVGKQGYAIAVPILGKEVVVLCTRSLGLMRSPRLARASANYSCAITNMPRNWGRVSSAPCTWSPATVLPQRRKRFVNSAFPMRRSCQPPLESILRIRSKRYSWRSYRTAVTQRRRHTKSSAYSIGSRKLEKDR